MPNVMVTLPNIGGALCSTPQFGWRPLLEQHCIMKQQLKQPVSKLTITQNVLVCTLHHARVVVDTINSNRCDTQSVR